MRPDVLLERVSDRITALSAADWQIDGNDGGTFAYAWHEAEAPFSPGDEPDSTRHLAFAVVNPSSPPVEDADHGDPMRVASRVEVLFEYVLRPAHQVADYRSALRAARQVAFAIHDESSWSIGDDVEVRITELGAANFTPDGGAAGVRVAFIIHHDEEA